MDISEVVQNAIDEIMSGELVEPSDMIEESFVIEEGMFGDVVVEESVKEVFGRVGNESLRIVKSRLSKEFDEWSEPTVKAAEIIAPEILTAMLKKDTKFVTKLAETSGTAFKHYAQQVIMDISSELISTGVNYLSKDITKKYNKVKEIYEKKHGKTN